MAKLTYEQLLQENEALRARLAQEEQIPQAIRKEQELRKLNRSLRALSRSNQALARAQNESQYLKEVCEVLVEDCGHEMVGISFAEQNEAKTVRPVAYAGFEEGYLETLNLTWADTDRGRGPTGTAIRTGKPQDCSNLLTDPHFEPWRQEALRRGYASSIVIPLLEQGVAIGAITIYSKEPNPFSEAEVELLTNLASDMVSGLAIIRARESEQQALAALRESEHRYHSLFTTMAEGFVLSEIVFNDEYEPADLRMLEVNPSFEKITGRKQSELVGNSLATAFPATTSHWLKRCGRVGLTSEPVRLVIHSKKLNRYFEIFAYSYTSGKVACIVVDTTFRKNAERSLRSQAQHLEQLVRERTARLQAAVAELEHFSLGKGSRFWLEFRKPGKDTR